MNLNPKENPLPSTEEMANETLVLILAGGRGSRLYELTDQRAKPAVYFGGANAANAWTCCLRANNSTTKPGTEAPQTPCGKTRTS